RRGLGADQLAGLDGAPHVGRHRRCARRHQHGRCAVTLAANLDQFGQDAWWLVLVKVVLIFAFLVVITLFTIWYERRVVARMQVRPGPNRNGPLGLLQSLADGLKLAFKEDIMPKLADKVVYFFAPVISTVCAFTAFAVIPFGPDRVDLGSQVTAAAHRHPGRRAAGARVLVDGRLRRRARWLGVGFHVPAAGWPPVERADDLVRGGDGPVLRRRVHDRRHDVDQPDRGRPGAWFKGQPRLPALHRARLVRDPAHPQLPDLLRLGGRGDQPGPVRPARGGVGAGRWLPHRVLVAEVRAVLPRRVHQYGDRLGAVHDAVPRRLAHDLAVLRLASLRLELQ